MARNGSGWVDFKQFVHGCPFYNLIIQKITSNFRLQFMVSLLINQMQMAMAIMNKEVDNIVPRLDLIGSSHGGRLEKLSNYVARCKMLLIRTHLELQQMLFLALVRDTNKTVIIHIFATTISNFVSFTFVAMITLTVGCIPFNS